MLEYKKLYQIMSSVGCIFIGCYMSYTTLSDYPLDYKYHPYASFIGGVIPYAIGSIFIYFSTGKLFERMMSKWVRCPLCDSMISRNATVCRHCRRDVPPASPLNEVKNLKIPGRTKMKKNDVSEKSISSIRNECEKELNIHINFVMKQFNLSFQDAEALTVYGIVIRNDCYLFNGSQYPSISLAKSAAEDVLGGADILRHCKVSEMVEARVKQLKGECT